MDAVITVLGLDGRPLDPPAAAALARAALVVGGSRQLAAVPVPRDARRVVMGDVCAAVEELTGYDGPGTDAVVLASGDPGFFGIVRRLRARGLAPTVRPATSSVALAFGRVGLRWDDAIVVSAHGRGLRRALNAARRFDKVAVLTAPGAGPAEIGAALADRSDRRLVVAERLGTDVEQVTELTPAAAAGRTWTEPNVTLVLDREPADSPAGWLAGGRPQPTGWALPEAAYEHRDAMVTKAEVRALALARLGPGIGDLVWDVGAGSGSVAVECARFGAAVVAVDRDPEAAERVRRNAAHHGVPVQTVTGAAPAALDPLPDPDAVFVGGGGPEVVAACAGRRPRAVVVPLAAVDRVAAVRDVLRGAAYDVDGVLLQASRLRGLPDGGSRLAATNPVLLLWGSR